VTRLEGVLALAPSLRVAIAADGIIPVVDPRVSGYDETGPVTSSIPPVAACFSLGLRVGRF